MTNTANVTFEMIEKNGKSYVRMNAFGVITDMKVYKTNTENPYVRYGGEYIYLDENMKRCL